MKRFILVLFILGAFFLNESNKIFAQDAYLGDIKMTAITFTQDGWLDCNGQLLQIIQYQALYSLLGITYGGDGRTTFALPDLRGRVPVCMGQGTGLSTYTQGQKGGVETVALTTAQMPAHTHGVAVSTAAGNSSSPSTTYSADSGNFDKEYSTSSNATNTVMVQSAGGGAAHENRQPYFAVRYVICVDGYYPPRP